MSSALAISAVTAVIQSLLNGVYAPLSSVLGGVTVSAVAPDIVQTALGTGSNTPLQVNLFLHQVTFNPAWRNQGYPSLGPDGVTPLANPPLALDLHYLLTAYAGADTVAEALLGFAVLLCHLNPVLVRTQIITALNSVPSSTNPLSGVLKNSGLAEQIETIKITPDTLGREEVAWIWTALKADYRPTFAFQASVVLIQPDRPTTDGLPVLTRKVTAQPNLANPFAQLTGVQLPPGQMAQAQGDSVTLLGSGLSTVTGVVLSNVRLGVHRPAFAPDSANDTSVIFKIPTDANNLPAGFYDVALEYTDTSGATQTTNSVTLGIAATLAAPVASLNGSGVLVKLDCNPKVQPFQSVSLALGSSAVPAQAFATPAASLSFQFPPMPAKKYLARLQVDGVDSPVSIDFTANPPVFLGPFITVP